MTLNKFRQVWGVIVLALAVNLFYNCKKKLDKNNNSNKFTCKKIKYKGELELSCKTIIENKVVVFSKTKNSNKVEFFVVVFDSSNIKDPYLNVYDFIKDCPVDFDISLINDSVQITDLDNDNIKELTFLYELVCQGGIGPSKMKLIMIEGLNKFKIRGHRFDEVSIKNKKFPTFYPKSKVDKSFQKAPEVFVNYAENLWKENYGTEIVKKEENDLSKTKINNLKIIEDSLFVNTANNEELNFRIPFFLEDETPTLISESEIIISFSDSYGNSVRTYWTVINKELYLDEILGKFPLKNKESNNLKVCKIKNLSLKIDDVNVYTLQEKLQNSDDCKYEDW